MKNAPPKTRKKRIALPRRQWQINPVTRVKSSRKLYSRLQAKKQILRNEE